MYEKPVFKVAASIILSVLLAFTVVSCTSPTNDDGSTGGGWDNTPTVPIGKGTPRFVYLNADYESAETDTGRTLLYIEDNEVAEGVAVISEIPNNNIANDNTVRVVNTNNNSVISFFFRKNQSFPYQVVIQSEQGTITGNFSLYDPVDEWYSVRFEKDGESCRLVKIYLNEEFGRVYKNQDSLSEKQNLRIRNAVTALAVWDSIALQIPGKKFLVTGRHPGSRWDGNEAAWFQKAVAGVFQAIPVVAFGASVARCDPAAFIMTFQTRIIGESVTNPIPEIPGNALSAPKAATGNNPGMETVLTKTKETYPDGLPIPASPISPGVTVTMQGTTIPNNSVPYDLITVGDTLTFELQFYGGYPVNDTTPYVNLFDPVLSKYSIFSDIVSVAKNVNAADHCTITVAKADEGYIRDGAVQTIIRFGYDMIINSSDAGVDFASDTDTTVPQHRKDAFIININTKPSET